jgi:hypothetical protein
MTDFCLASRDTRLIDNREVLAHKEATMNMRTSSIPSHRFGQVFARISRRG